MKKPLISDRRVLVEAQSPGVWLVRTVTAAPAGEAWLDEPEAAARLERALRWAAANPPDDANTGQRLRELGGDLRISRTRGSGST